VETRFLQRASFGRYGVKRPGSPASSRFLCRCGQSASPAAQEYPAHPIRDRTDQRTHAPISQSDRRSRVQRSCPPLVGASFASFASAQARKLIRCAAPPLRITNASLVCDSV
jgi:hypothetical protein